MTNKEAIEALRAEFPFYSGNKLRKAYDKAKRAGQSVTEACETVRKMAKAGLRPNPRISNFDPTGHEATLRAEDKISSLHVHGICRSGWERMNYV